MSGIFIVSEITPERITVTPLPKDSENGETPVSHIEVINPKKFKISIGTKVYAGFPQAMERFQGFSAVLFPVLMSVLGYMLSGTIAVKLKCTETELFKFLCISVFYFVSYGFVIALSRNIKTVMKQQILGLVKA